MQARPSPYVSRNASLARRFASSTEGATSIEYGLIALGIAIAIVLGVQLTGTAVNGVFVDIDTLL